MADIKKLSIFSGNNDGLDRIKKEREKEKQKEQEKVAVSRPVNTPVRPAVITRIPNMAPPKKPKPVRKVGAPIKNFDKVFAAKQSIKVSALLNSISRVLSEKYMAGRSRDEIIRRALNEYIKQSLTKEDKLDLLADVERDLEVFRRDNPTIDQIDENGEISRTAEELEAETSNYLRDSWNL